MSQDASADPADTMINRGVLAWNADGERGGGERGVGERADEKRGGGRTFIVTGQQRAGTSLVAAVLRQVGVFMGAEINDEVHEDEAMGKILLARDRDGLRRIIGERDAGFGTWGFKFPMLSDVLAPADLALFSNPHVIVRCGIRSQWRYGVRCRNITGLPPRCETPPMTWPPWWNSLNS